jgi:DNA-binding NtrC family response regulator
MLRVPNVLLLCGSDAEAEALENGLAEHVNLTRIRNLTELKERTDADRYDALFCGWSFHRTRWEDAMAAIRIIVKELPVVFLSQSAGPKEWVEVWAAGGFDLLIIPADQGVQVHAALERIVESSGASTLPKSSAYREARAV